MCLFTAEVEIVTDTNIYARGKGERQTLVYSMKYAASSPLAMVLPIPVPPGSGDDAVRFIDLSKCAMFFEELGSGFPTLYDDGVGALLSADLGGEVEERPKLEVREVGAYEASYVPRPMDFGRLDERFRLPAELWVELKNYTDWGFAVFQLRETKLAEVHPMAFDFPRRDKRLFFPTLHIHHGRLEKRAEFDHTLYCQPEPAQNWHLQQWEDSYDPVAKYVHCAEALKLFDGGFPAWRTLVRGVRENRDIWIGKGEMLPAAA